MAEKTVQEQFDELKGHHEGVMVSLATLQTKLDDALQREADSKLAHAADLDAVRKQVTDELAAKHASEILELKEKTLFPAMRDLQARQKADLEAKHAAELDSLR